MLERPASTSLLLAAAALLAPPRDAREQLAAELAEAALDLAGPTGRWLQRLARRRAGRAVLTALERAALPGLTAHYRWRKRRLARWADAAIARGTTQLLVLGAGFDALASWLVARHAGLTALEIDRAPSVACKREALQRLGGAPPRLHLAACDLVDAAALRAVLGPLDPRAPVLVVAEGLLMYLSREGVARLTATLAGHFAPPPLLLGSAMQQRPGGEPGFEAQSTCVAGWLRQRGEPFRWGIDPAQPAQSLGSLGLTVESAIDPRDPSDPDPAPGEWLFRARLVAPTTARAPLPPVRAAAPTA